MSDEFTVHVDDLDKIGKVHLPKLRDSLNGVLATAKQASAAIPQVFDTAGGPPYSDMPETFHLFWQPGKECFLAMDYLQRALADNAENVDLAGQAIVEIAHRYRVADGQA